MKPVSMFLSALLLVSLPAPYAASDDVLWIEALELPAELPALHVTLRYARQTAGESVVRVTLDGGTHHSRSGLLESLLYNP